MLSSLLLSRLTPYAEEVIGDHHCGFRSNRSTTDHIFCIREIFKKIWKYNKAVYPLYINFKKADHSVKREDVYNILMSFISP
jgi:hypothetical protein